MHELFSMILYFVLGWRKTRRLLNFLIWQQSLKTRKYLHSNNHKKVQYLQWRQTPTTIMFNQQLSSVTHPLIPEIPKSLHTAKFRRKISFQQTLNINTTNDDGLIWHESVLFMNFIDLKSQHNNKMNMQRAQYLLYSKKLLSYLRCLTFNMKIWISCSRFFSFSQVYDIYSVFVSKIMRQSPTETYSYIDLINNHKHSHFRSCSRDMTLVSVLKAISCHHIYNVI